MRTKRKRLWQKDSQEDQKMWDRFAKVVALIPSSNRHESDAAANRALEMLKTAGVTGKDMPDVLRRHLENLGATKNFVVRTLLN